MDSSRTNGAPPPPSSYAHAHLKNRPSAKPTKKAILAMHQLRFLTSIVSVGAVVTMLTTSPTIRTTITRFFSPSSHPYRFVTLMVALVLNFKSLPFFWHWRFLRSMLYQLYLQPTPLPRDALFRPIVSKSNYTPLPECDYNGHKSNSTYFMDLDIARTQLISCLLRTGIRTSSKRRKRDEEESRNTENPLPEGKYMIALGGVSCNFKKELKPYEKFEIWTRVLSWDRKWVYVVSHMVKAGAVKPDGWALQPWKARGIGPRKPQANGSVKTEEAEQKEEWKDAIFASSMSKYVVKKGRMTIHPEQVLRNSNLLPPRPEDRPDANGNAAHIDDDWTWERVEKERDRGYELAQHFAALDGIHDEFPIAGGKVDQVEILGQYTDLYI